MLTEAGCLSGLSSRMNGMKKSPHCWTNTKIDTTARPGSMRGSTIRVSDWTQFAPSTQDASSRLIGTPSMKFFISQMANGNEVADMKKIVAGIESVKLKLLNMAYTGTMIAVTGSPVEKRMMYRNDFRYRI